VKSKLDKLLSSLKELEKKRYNCEKARQHHTRERKKALDLQDFKKYKRHQDKWDFHNQILESIRLEILAAKERINGEKNRIAIEKYNKKRGDFDRTMTENFTPLVKALQLLIERLEISNIDQIANKIYDFYTVNSTKLKPIDLAPYEQLSLQGMRITCGHIIQLHGEMQTSATVGGKGRAAQRKFKVVTYATNLKNQIEDCLLTLRNRNTKGGNETWIKRNMKKLKNLSLAF